MIAVVAHFNQEKALVAAFSVIVQLYQLIVYSTNSNELNHGPGILKQHLIWQLVTLPPDSTLNRATESSPVLEAVTWDTLTLEMGPSVG